MSKKRRQEEQYIINENPEISVGENPGWVGKIISAFPALQNRNYRSYFVGQLISLIGTWLQIVAQGWLVSQLTQSAFMIGLVMALGSVPTLLFTLFGGVIVDRFPKRKVLIITQISAMLLAFLLGTLTLLHVVTVWQIGIIAFLLGVVNAVDAPARQAFVSEMVTKEQLSSAIALNSSIFNAARVIGPGFAGVLIALVDSGGAFIVNGISYIAVIIALFSMRLNTDFVPKKINPIEAIQEGLHYSFSHPVIRTLLLFAGVVSVFGWSYMTVMPIIAKNVFHLGAAGLGYLYSASGAGSLAAAIVVGAFSRKWHPIVFIFGGNLLFAISITLFSFTTNFELALLLLFVTGFGLLAQAATINTTVQRMVRSDFRGRVMSIYILMFIGLAPLGNLQMGYISENWSTDVALQLNGIIVFIFGLSLFLYRNKIKAAYLNYKKVVFEHSSKTDNP